MPLEDDYLLYPHRHYGMDQDRYAWRPSSERPKLALPGDAAVGAVIVVPIEHHMLNPQGKPFKHPGAMVTTYPDLRHYTTRDYGNRVGVFRILKALKHYGLKATFPVNAAALDRFKPLLEAILADRHEIAAYGWDTDHIHWGGLDESVEAQWIADTRAAFDAAGLKPRTWMSPARQQSFNTLDLIAAEGFDICLDWEQDTTPVAMATQTTPVTAIPLSNEIDDRILMIDRRQTEDEWATQVLEAARYLKDDAARYGAQVLGFTLTPYVSGQPFRIHALKRILAGLAGDAAVSAFTATGLMEAL
jgi:peptidoglycan/xylan/chitin deacetylase (PgdA/CDA1 family)